MNIQIGSQKLFFGDHGNNQKIIGEIMKDLGYSSVKCSQLSGVELSRFISKVESVIDSQISKLENGDFRVKAVIYKGSSYQISLSGRSNTDLYFLIRLYDKITSNQVEEISVDINSTP